jgi:hypothetical protein
MTTRRRLQPRRATQAILATLATLATLVAATSLPSAAHAAPGAPNEAAQTDAPAPKVVFGIKASPGGRFDNVRMCVASPAGAKGGPSMDVSFNVELPLSRRWSLTIDVPVFRPILFGVAFKMLQFEPEVTFAYRIALKGRTDVLIGPSLGLTMHYGPDYHSAASGANRGPSFYAMGPRMGVYLGLDFKRPHKTFNFQLGLRPYVTPLFSIDDPADHRGVVIGGQLEALFRFSVF